MTIREMMRQSVARNDGAMACKVVDWFRARFIITHAEIFERFRLQTPTLTLSEFDALLYDGEGAESETEAGNGQVSLR